MLHKHDIPGSNLLVGTVPTFFLFIFILNFPLFPQLFSYPMHTQVHKHICTHTTPTPTQLPMHRTCSFLYMWTHYAWLVEEKHHQSKLQTVKTILGTSRSRMQQPNVGRWRRATKASTITNNSRKHLVPCTQFQCCPNFGARWERSSLVHYLKHLGQ